MNQNPLRQQVLYIFRIALVLWGISAAAVAEEKEPPLLTPPPRELAWTDDSLDLGRGAAIRADDPAARQVGRMLAGELQRLRGISTIFAERGKTSDRPCVVLGEALRGGIKGSGVFISIVLATADHGDVMWIAIPVASLSALAATSRRTENPAPPIAATTPIRLRSAASRRVAANVAATSSARRPKVQRNRSRG